MHAGGVSGGGGGSYGKKDPLEELVAAVPSQRNWKGMAIAILVILSVIGLVALAVVIITPPDPGPRIAGRRIQLTDILSGRHKPRYFNGSWISGTELLYQDPSGGLTIHNFLNNSSRHLMSNSTFRQLNSHSYSVSADLQYVLIEYNKEKLFRHSYSAQFSLYSIANSTHTSISLRGDSNVGDRSQLAVWSPVSHSLVIVVDNDLYYIADASKKDITRLTNTGQTNLIYNGVADWLYEEEILGQSRAVWFSTDGKRLLYATFNVTQVGKVSFKLYGDLHGKEYPLYGDYKTVRYPKTGTKNPTVTLTVVTLNSGRQIPVIPPSTMSQGDYYFTSVRWVHGNVVSILWMNRIQNTSSVTTCAPPKYQCVEVYNEKISGGRGWVENTGPPVFSQSGDSMLVIRPVQDSEAGYFPQLVHVDIAGGAPSDSAPTSLTHGQFEVTKLLAWDEASHLVYYIATLPGSPGVRHLFRVGDDHNQESPAECLTCRPESTVSDTTASPHLDSGSTTSLPPTTTTVQSDADMSSTNETEYYWCGCDYAQVQLSHDFSHYVLDCLGPNVPQSSVFSLPDNNFVQVLDANDDLKDSLQLIATPKTKELEVPLPRSRVPAKVKLLMPPGYRENEEFTFALILKVYGGPGTQEVSSRWTFDWDHYLAGNRDFIVATIDVRGSGFAGSTFKHAVYNELGTVETLDSLHVLRHLVENLSFVDQTRVAVWGWSYGGYVAARMLAEDDTDLLSCAVSVAPVVKWQLYDSAYTERYMGFPGPTGNWKGYENSDLTTMANKFQGKNFFLIHGTADDNVHFQQSMVLTRALVDRNVLFRLQVYPDQSHSLPNVRHHQYLAMEDFFLGCFNPSATLSVPNNQLVSTSSSVLPNNNNLNNENAELASYLPDLLDSYWVPTKDDQARRFFVAPVHNRQLNN